MIQTTFKTTFYKSSNTIPLNIYILKMEEDLFSSKWGYVIDREDQQSWALWLQRNKNGECK